MDNIMSTTTTAADTLRAITAGLDAGRTVYIGTYTRTTKVTPHVAASWAGAGRPVFRLMSDGALAMARGRGYVRLTCGDTLLVRVVIQ